MAALVLALGVVAAIFVGALTEDPLKGVQAGAAVALALAAFIPVLILFIGFFGLLPVAVHELGHYLAGRSVGFDFVTFVVGPFGIREQKGRRVPYRVRPAPMGGYVAMLPPDEIDLVPRFRRFIVGGPLASLLWIVVVFGLWKLSGLPFVLPFTDVPERLSAGARFALMGFQVSAYAAIAMLLGTLIPQRIKSMGGLPNDMLRLIELRRDGPEARRMIALLILYRQLMSGTRARDLAPHLIADATAVQDDSTDELSGLQLRWAYELNHDLAGIEPTARRHAELLEKLKQKLPAEWQASGTLLQAEHALIVRKDAEAARSLLETADHPHPQIAAARATLAAALAAHDGNPDLTELIADARKAIVDAQTTSNISWDWELELLDGLDSTPNEGACLD